MRNPYLKVFYRAYDRWKQDQRKTLRYEFPSLTPDSIVFDIGGFKGEWTDTIHERFGSTVHIFEPHPRFAKTLAEKYKDNEKIIVHAFALGSADCKLNLSDAGDASSAVSGAPAPVRGEVVDVARYLRGFQHPRIEVAKINIEGGEYDLLPAIIAAGEMRRFALLQIQFHLFEEANIAMRNSIVENLAKTHKQDWCYEFVWEQWSLRWSD